MFYKLNHITLKTLIKYYMIEILGKHKRQDLLYVCKAGDTLESIGAQFGLSTTEILRTNPLFSSVYEGCVLYLAGLGKTRITVAPLQSLEDIAEQYHISTEEIMKMNNLRSRKVFVGMQLVIDKKED
ncbi:MAG: LysM peptidoglycan-binding domain-containing protein [Clostridia bacterium]|nr:LysM peptidoglycan-binding domain-containing protein [Clostridia bacterium]